MTTRVSPLNFVSVLAFLPPLALGPDLPLALDPTPEVKAVFDFPVFLEYVVTLAERQLGTDIHVTNHSSTDALQFQALFHNYIRAPANAVTISPLTGKTYFDKTEATPEARAAPKVEQRKVVDVQKFTDSVYEDAGQAYEVGWPQGGIQIKTEGLKDVVIWNPQKTAGEAIADMEDGGWCVRIPGFQSLSTHSPQGEICLRRTRPRTRLRRPSDQRGLGWPAGSEIWVVTKQSCVRINRKDLPRPVSARVSLYSYLSMIDRSRTCSIRPCTSPNSTRSPLSFCLP